MTGLQKRAATAFIVVFVGLGVVDATPVVSPSHARLKNRIDAFMDATGLWQGNWRLFAPMPRKINVYVSARFVSGDVAVDWHSPRWTQMGFVEKFFHVRHMKFYDAIRLDENRRTWEAFAEYQRRQLPPTIQDDITRRIVASVEPQMKAAERVRTATRSLSPR